MTTKKRPLISASEIPAIVKEFLKKHLTFKI